jgi:hypothetical protein
MISSFHAPYKIFSTLQRAFTYLKKSYKGHELKIVSKSFFKTFLRLFSMITLCYVKQVSGFVNFSGTNRERGKGSEQERERPELSEYDKKYYDLMLKGYIDPVTYEKNRLLFLRY